MKIAHLALIITLLFPLSSCTSVRQSRPLAYAGDGRETVESLESAIQKRGYKPICKRGEFCKFAYGEQVWIHYKTSGKKVVLAVDVTDGKKLPAGRVQALTDEATKVAESIWAEASTAALAKEKALAEQKVAEKKARAEREAADDAAEARAEASRPASTPSGGSAESVLTGLLTGGGPSGSAPGGVSVTGGASSSMTCCINHSFYECPSAAAVNKCSGDASACLMGCMNSSDSNCSDRCMREHPPDPSGCSRKAPRDGECR